MTLEILLHGKYGGVALVDDSDWGCVSEYRWHSHKSRRTYYAYAKVDGTDMSMHRLILGVPPRTLVDHIDFNGLNNVRINLRTCTVAENGRHSRMPIGRSGFRGVQFTAISASGRHWRAAVKVNGRVLVAGHFETPIEAAYARDNLARIHHGQFAFLNFPQSPATPEV